MLDVRRTPALEVRPGDEIRVQCVYQSLTRTETTFYGPTKSDEMCAGMLAYYPAVPTFTYCGQWRTVDYCTNTAGHKCNFSAADPLWNAVEPSCVNGCSDACIEKLKDLNSTRCLTGDTGKYLQPWFPQLPQIVDLQKRCFATSNQLALKAFWPLHPVALIATNYLVMHFV